MRCCVLTSTSCLTLALIAVVPLAHCARNAAELAVPSPQGIATSAGVLRTARLATQAQGGRHKNDPRLETIARSYDLVLMSSNVYVRPPEILKAINPDMVVFGYVNSSDETPDAEGYVGYEQRLGHAGLERKLPEDWYVHDAEGARIGTYSGMQRLLTDRTRRGYQEWKALHCQKVAAAGYDGIFLDNFGTAVPGGWKPKFSGAIDGIPNSRWQDGLYEYLKTCKQAIGPDKLLIWNGISGSRREPGSGLSGFAQTLRQLEVSDGGMMEHWLGRGTHIDEGVVDIVEIHSRMNRLDKLTYPITSADSPEDGFRGFCVYLLAMSGQHAYFECGPWYDFLNVYVGVPDGKYELQDGVLVREFTRGFVALNPYFWDRTIRLPRRYRDADGNVVRETTVVGKGGVILFDPALAPDPEVLASLRALGRSYPAVEELASTPFQEVSVEDGAIIIEAEDFPAAQGVEVVALEGAGSGEAVRMHEEYARLQGDLALEEGLYTLTVRIRGTRRNDSCYLQLGRQPRIAVVGDGEAWVEREFEVELAADGLHRIVLSCRETGTYVDRITLRMKRRLSE